MARRGQAFETMMLVISVIVALAILGVLTGILGQISFGTDTPDKLMHDKLKDIVPAGYGQSVPMKATLKRSTRLDLRQVIKSDMPELDPGTIAPVGGPVGTPNIRFCLGTGIPAAQLPNLLTCQPPTGAGGTRALSGGSNSLGPATTDVSFFFAVCADSNLGQRGIYRIQIAGTQQEAGAGCVV